MICVNLCEFFANISTKVFSNSYPSFFQQATSQVLSLKIFEKKSFAC